MIWGEPAQIEYLVNVDRSALVTGLSNKVAIGSHRNNRSNICEPVRLLRGRDKCKAGDGGRGDWEILVSKFTIHYSLSAISSKLTADRKSGNPEDAEHGDRQEVNFS
jgi:hypothetical protein